MRKRSSLIGLDTLKRDSDGATAIEFAMVGPILITMIFSILELSWLILKILMVDNAVQMAAKEIYVGNVPDRAAFEALICERLPLFNNCREIVNIEAIQINGYSDIPRNEAECRDRGEQNFTPTRTYTTGTSSAIMFLRVCVTAPLITPGLGFGASLPQRDDGTFAVVSSTVFVNEPF